MLQPRQAVAQRGAYWSTNYYGVSGSSIREIRQSIRHNRPARVDRDALTECNVRTRFSVSPFQGEYRCAGFTATVTIRMTLPRWTAPEGAPDSVREAWERYSTALIQHEVGHAQFALSQATELHRRVKELGTSSDPDSLSVRVQAMVQQTGQEFREREREYDRLTNHGIEQGVTLALTESGEPFAEPGPRRRVDSRQH